MCSTLLIESIQYFVKIQSPGYVLFIDASKAFDRVCYSHLYSISEERGVCPLTRRLLFIMYKNQRIRVCWNTCLSDISEISNGSSNKRRTNIPIGKPIGNPSKPSYISYQYK